MNYVIQQARLVDPQLGLDQVMDLSITAGQISAIESQIQAPDSSTCIDGSGMILTPAFTDLLTYLRQPGNGQKGTIASESHAAASAGFTHVLPSPDTQPVTDTAALIKLVQDQAQLAGACDVYPMAALTQQLDSQHLTNMHSLQNAGAIAFSNAGVDIKDNRVLLRCYEYAATFGIRVFIQARDHALSAGHMHEGALATRLGLNGIPVIAETLAISRHLQILEHTDVQGHFQQISSAKGVELIRKAKQAGMAVTADVDIAHLYFTEQALHDYQSQFHTQPPLRSESDRQALLAGLADGTLDAIVSAHQPHELAAKQAPFGDTDCGMTIYDGFIPMLMTLIEAGDISLHNAINALTHQATRIAGIDSTTLAIGSSANLCLIHPNIQWQLTPTSQVSLGSNQCFLGQNLTGRVVHTWKQGQITWQG